MAQPASIPTATPVADELQARAVAVLDAFDGDITRVRVPLFYRLGLFVATLVMVLLPVCYLGLIGLLGYGAFWHATTHTGLLHWPGRRVALVALLLYAAPLVAALVLAFFLLKPFLAREARRPQSFMLSPSGEPLLFAFLQKICGLVGAPVPKRVQVNCEVNASASFRRGLWSLFGNDLTLTIGLPLAAGLSVREFAGVLAHEFGHFAQGTGMRLTYLIFRINGWFARVVYERDEWDEWLVYHSEESDSRIGFVLYFARFGVWVSRRILWLWMIIGHAVSCFLLRQMEFDADRYQTKVAGSDGFASTMKRIRLLAFAHAQAVHELEASWKTGQLPDNLPRYLVHWAQLVPEDVKKRVNEESARAKTRLFHTHPADAARVRRAEQLGASGVFRLDEPAAILFKDFHELCRSLTLYHYQQDLELKITPQNLVATEETMTGASAEVEGGAAVDRYFLSGTTLFRPLALTEADVRPLPDPNQSLANLVEARQRMQAARARTHDALKAWTEADERAIRAHQAGQLLLVGFKIRPKDFQVGAATGEAAKQAEAEAMRELARASSELEEFDRDARTRLASALQLLQEPEVLAAFENREELQREMVNLVRVLDSLRPALVSLFELRKEHAALYVLITNRENFSDIERVDFRIHKVAQTINRTIADVQLKLCRVPFPFSHARGRMFVADYARHDPPDPHAVLNALQQCTTHLQRLPMLYSRIIGRLVLVAEQVEARLAQPDAEQVQA